METCYNERKGDVKTISSAESNFANAGRELLSKFERAIQNANPRLYDKIVEEAANGKRLALSLILGDSAEITLDVQSADGARINIATLQLEAAPSRLN